MKSTWFNDPDRREFGKLLHAADYRMHVGEVFNVFLECATCTLRQAVHKFVTNEVDEAIEDQYMKAIERVQKPKHLAEAFGRLSAALEVDRYDFLGTFSGEVGMNDKKYSGQVFTPRALATITARMTMQDLKPKFGRTLMLDEPACGGGAMIIAAADILIENGFQMWNYHFRGSDLSRRCFRMTYIQTTLLSIPCVVHCANTLTLEEYDSARNLISMMYPPRRRKDDEPEPVEDVNEEVECDDTITIKTQGTLFDA